jgi:hypothetical protein
MPVPVGGGGGIIAGLSANAKRGAIVIAATRSIFFIVEKD